MSECCLKVEIVFFIYMMQIKLRMVFGFLCWDISSFFFLFRKKNINLFVKFKIQEVIFDVLFKVRCFVV